MIVKVQRALAGSSSILIYDQPTETTHGLAHKIWAQLTMDESEIQDILGDDLKGYFIAHVDGDTMIGIGERIEDQDW